MHCVIFCNTTLTKAKTYDIIYMKDKILSYFKYKAIIQKGKIISPASYDTSDIVFWVDICKVTIKNVITFPLSVLFDCIFQ